MISNDNINNDFTNFQHHNHHHVGKGSPKGRSSSHSNNNNSSSSNNNKTKKLADLIIPLVSIIGLYWFAASFFLAKKSLSDVSQCDEAPLLLKNILDLTNEEISLVLPSDQENGQQQQQQQKTGCWLNRRVDSLVILVVDALRFDFARYELPQSVGSRIYKDNNNNNNKDDKNTTISSSLSSQLLQFVADPPTVTMQRLKGLTTGGLPTFADISGNFGGAAIDEDSWVQQLVDAPYNKRGLKYPSRRGFVGDDTWVDLFPTQFQESFPYPSFNTRDLDTVDNGCLKHLPTLLSKLRKTKQVDDKDNDDNSLEVLVAHFLGVDHVGHTYGPHNEHMTEKLQQMDAALSTTLELLDEAPQGCHLALIFGDHGMTEDGNHGGGTDEEINAALFVHFSPGCQTRTNGLSSSSSSSLLTTTEENKNILGSTYVENIFQSIHQIDLVPTISILLGLPIPYANIGGIAPSLLGFDSIRDTAAALALNAAQVWRYFTVYSETANKLPNLPELQERLDQAVAAYKEALRYYDAEDSNAFYKACGLFKIFLVEASELGHRVWTRFDTTGMILGGAVLFLALAMSIALLFFEAVYFRIPSPQFMEIGLTAVFGIFQIGMLSFSNSYIEAEQRIVMFFMAIIGIAIFVRMNGTKAGGNARVVPHAPLLIPILSRIAESVVSGHGLDPSIRLHPAHSPLMFLPALVSLAALRVYLYKMLPFKGKSAILHCSTDCVYITLVAMSWIEKRSLDQSRNGFYYAKGAVALLLLGIPAAVYDGIALSLRHREGGKHLSRDGTSPNNSNSTNLQETRFAFLEKNLAIATKLLLAIMLVTGPATASTVLIIIAQGWMLFILGGATGFYETSPLVLAMLWRLLVRHVFFATNHGCAFNRLQYSAAFITTVEFDFVLGGLQLFLNTFGWEIVGLFVVRQAAMFHKKHAIWRWYCVFQCLESFINCISVSVLRRHLMVWAIYAPRFLFSSIFLILNSLGQLVIYFLIT